MNSTSTPLIVRSASVGQVFDTVADIGLLAEFQYDGRSKTGDAPFTTTDHDLFLGSRLAFNDESGTAVLAGVLMDAGNGSVAGFVEAERRLSEHWKAELEARLFFHADDEDPIATIRRDDSITVRLSYYF